MTTILAEQIAVELARFSSTTRLYELSIDGSGAGLGTKELLVEAFLADDALNELDVRDLIVLSTNAYLELEKLLGQSASLQIALANGSRTSFAGEISKVAMLGSDGGLARYRVRISPWLWRLGQVRNSRVWQDKTVIGIVDSVFEAYLPLARWRWSDEISSFMAGIPPRGYCCHKKLASERKAVLFALLPGCSEEAADASPFLTPFDPADKTLKALLRRCDRWPMLSVIATPESIEQLVRRLSAWCVIEVDGQAFNFRFPDTRRLPAIVDVLNPTQRAQFLGPATGWTYIGRNGCWHALAVESSSADIADSLVRTSVSSESWPETAMPMS